MTPIALFLLTLAPGPVEVPSPWHYPAPADVSQAWRDESGHRYLQVTADFDGDAKEDRAGLFVNAQTHEDALVVLLGAQPDRAVVLQVAERPEWLNSMGVELVKPGSYRTACGKGYWECGEGEPEVLTIRLPAIALFQVESARSYFFYDSVSGSFRRVWISD